MSKRVITTLLVLAGAGLFGCRHPVEDDNSVVEDEETAFVEDGTDTSAVESDSELVTSSLVSSAPGTIGLASVSSGDLQTQDVGVGVSAIYLPRGCVSVRGAEGAATYQFTNCLTGPNGLRLLTGTVKVRYSSPAEGTLHLEIDHDLQVNNAKVTGLATADITSNESARTMTWKAKLAGTTGGGKTFTRTTQHEVKWLLGEPCFELNGSSEGIVTRRNGNTRDIKTEISGFKRCRRGCPEAGGSITVTNVTKDKRATVSFDGTARATFTAPNGRESSVLLLCRP